jgi:hypothetical protein
MIENLTPEQVAKFPEYVAKWNKIGLNTQPCDFEKAKAGAIKAYELAGLKAPEHFFIFDCPVTAAIGAGLIKAYLFPEDSAKDAENIEPSEIMQKVNKALLAQLPAKFAKQSKKAMNMAHKDLKSNFSKYVQDMIFGSMEASWLSLYDYFHREVGIDLSKLQGLNEIAENCGWWAPYEKVVIFQHRPEEIHLNERNVLHNPNGPALAYRGGVVKLWYYNGVAVNEKIITKNFTWQDIDKENNLEVRRVMVEIYGQAKYILDSGATIVSQDDYGTLYKKEQGADEPIYMVKVVNSTPEPDGTFKDYFIRVDPKAYGGIKTAQAAVASTWRNKDGSMLFIRPEEYVCEVQT